MNIIRKQAQRHKGTEPQRKYFVPLLLCFFVPLLLVWGCETVPYSGRSQLLLIPEQEEMTMGLQAYQQALSKARVSTDSSTNSMVKTIGQRIATVANKPDYRWEFNVIDDAKTANAFALPGGKVAVYTGLLPYTQTEDGLAFVIAHEIGHAIARHGGERMTQQMLLQYGQQGLNAMLQGGAASSSTIDVMNTVYGVSANLGILLPYSRSQEYEADQIGLMLMAKAGYDPRQAPNFFRNMLSAKKGGRTPVFLSTHPADEDRIQKINQLIPKAMQYYRR